MMKMFIKIVVSLKVGSIEKSIRSEGHIHCTQIHVLTSMLPATSF